MTLLEELKLIQEEILYHGKKFPGYNKPIKSDNPEKKLMVLAKNKSGDVKLLHFGAKGMSDYTIHKDKERRARFHARHKCDQEKDILTRRWWSCQHLW